MSMRTHYCGLTSEALLDQTVSLCGWVHRRRDHGGVIFIDLRDRDRVSRIPSLRLAGVEVAEAQSRGVGEQSSPRPHGIP